MTIEQLEAAAAGNAQLLPRLLSARSAAERLAALPDSAAEESWLSHLRAWRETLCKELEALPVRKRTPLPGRHHNLVLSICVIDFGLSALKGTGYDLTNTRLGEVMAADGYLPVGADVTRNYRGEMPWHGSLPEVEDWLKSVACRRTALQAVLDDVLLDDAKREAQRTSAAQYRDIYNSLNLTLDGEGKLLIPHDAEGEVLDISTLTADQQEALARANREWGRESLPSDMATPTSDRATRISDTP